MNNLYNMNCIFNSDKLPNVIQNKSKNEIAQWTHTQFLPIRYITFLLKRINLLNSLNTMGHTGHVTNSIPGYRFFPPYIQF